jgi:hypothetical protein
VLTARLLGAATLAYSAAVLLDPKVIARPCEMLDVDGQVPPDVASSLRAVSARDAVVSLLMMAAPVGPALRTAVTVRAISDLSDAAVFGARVSSASRAKVIGVPLAWGLLCLATRRSAGGAT